MPKTCYFLTSTFSRSCIDFGGAWTSKLEPNWTSWAPRTLPKASKIQSFGSMCPRCLPRDSKKAPKKPQTSIFGGFSMDLGGPGLQNSSQIEAWRLQNGIVSNGRYHHLKSTYLHASSHLSKKAGGMCVAQGICSFL